MFKAPFAVTTKTTMKLVAGDVIQTGNCIAGFDSYSIVSIENASFNNRMAKLTIRFNNGSVGSHNVGKNAQFFVKVGA